MFFPDCGNSTTTSGGLGSLGNGLDSEDGGFGIYGDKTRYATLQKKRDPNNVNNSNTTVASVRGYETMRNLRTSIPSLVSTVP